MSQVRELLEHLKRRLRANAMTYKDLAARLDVSESTLKRWFSQGSFNVERLDEICQVLAIDLGELLPNRKARLKTQCLSEDQELELAADDTLLSIFYLALSGRTAASIVARYEISAVKLRTYLIRLDQLELIELHQDDRIVPLVDQSVRWLATGPLTAKYGRQIRHDFMDTDFEGENEQHWLLSGRMTLASLQVFDRKLEALLGELRELMELDQGLAEGETLNITFFAAHRPWVLPLLKGKRRL